MIMSIIQTILPIIAGILAIIYSRNVCRYIQKVYEKFPKYEDGVKAFKISFTVRPISITILAAIWILISLISLIGQIELN